MKKTRRTVEQIIRILREADSGLKTEEICRKRNISAQSYYRWRRKYGGMELKKLLAEQMLKSKALEIAMEKNL